MLSRICASMVAAGKQSVKSGEPKAKRKKTSIKAEPDRGERMYPEEEGAGSAGPQKGRRQARGRKQETERNGRARNILIEKA